VRDPTVRDIVRAMALAWCLAQVSPLWGGEAGQNAPTRFLVMADPHFRLTKPGDPGLGYGSWPNTCWPELPQLMKTIGANRLFVVGDILHHALGAGATVTEAWDAWDAYVASFDGVGQVEWSVGAHEFFNDMPRSEARRVFQARYAHRLRQRIVHGEDVFILLPEEDLKDPAAVRWLEGALQASASARRIWFFEHVPPGNTWDWWAAAGATAESERAVPAQIGALLEKHKVTAAFFGHLHQESYLGNPGGFPLFLAGVTYPLLVEVREDCVEYRWLVRPMSPDPLTMAMDALRTTGPRTRTVDEGRPLTWHVRIFPRGAELPSSPGDPGPAQANEAGGQSLAVVAGRVDLSALGNLQNGDCVLAATSYRVAPGSKSNRVLLETQLPVRLWINGVAQCALPATNGRQHSFLLPEGQEEIRLTLLAQVEDTGRTFSVRRQHYAQDLPPLPAK